MNNFTNLYSLSKTLRFELKPIGKTLDNIIASDILKKDNELAIAYKECKKIIDEYHKAFIEKSLSNCSIALDALASLAELISKQNKDDQDKKDIEKLQEKLRKQIAKQFDTKRLFGKELIKEDLLKDVWLDDYCPNTLTAHEKEIVKMFDNWTSYFTGFHENRKNIYTGEDIPTAIAYRLIHDNFPKFVNNCNAFKKIKEAFDDAKFDEISAELGITGISDYFNIENYTKCISQKQIDFYNYILGGKSEENKNKIKGLNEHINLYNQQQKDKKERLPKLTSLFKQILSGRVALSWLPEQFKNDNKVFESINKMYAEFNEKNIFNKLRYLLESINEFDLDGIYLRNDTGLTEIAKDYFGSWSAIKTALIRRLMYENPQGKTERTDKYDEKIEKKSKSDSYSIGYLNELGIDGDKKIEDYFKTHTKNNVNIFENIKAQYGKAKPLFENDYTGNLKDDDKSIELLKAFLDSILSLLHFIKPLNGKGDEQNKDTDFYEGMKDDPLDGFSEMYNYLDSVITPLYNKVRNYATQKPYSVEKIKLNFENSTLADGWDVNKEKDNTCVLLRKGTSYYLAIMNYKNKTDFNKKECAGECYEKVDYKLLPGANKMLPKVFFSNKGREDFKPNAELLDKYERGTHKKGDNFSLEDCHNLIDFFKHSIQQHKDWKNFDFHFSDTNKYEDMSGFYREVEQQGYKITFRNISENYVNHLVESGKIYLFQIYNKDFSSYSKGTPNMHTLYWKALFNEENLKDVIYKLNGEAEVFYRERSIKNDEITHPKGIPINNKNVLNNNKESTFEYDLIKDKRFRKEHHFQFHVPITMNFKATSSDLYNDKVNQFIKDGGVKHIIGIDRGERHLLYLCLIDLAGNIKQQFTLNEIGNKYKTDYHALLNEREGKRDEARKSWKKIENIKELKEGYLSQVVHKISELMVEYNAIVVLEDLNFGFMRGRQKVEKQVYQKFEKMLIDKLNYLVFKKKEHGEIGGLMNALQLTNKFESFKKLGKQSGFLFYIPALYTSKIDPVTGFVNMFNTKYENIEKAKKFFSNFADIRYNANKDYFEFVVDDYTKFSNKLEGTKLDWTICTYGERIKTFRNPEKNNKWDDEEIVLTNAFIALFEKYKIDYKNDLQNIILEQNDKSFFEELLFLFKLTVQLRNSNTENDYLLSPIEDANGNFFDSRNAEEDRPKDADANGAYNIARKGLWAIQQIKKADDLKKVKLAIDNKEWLNFVQNK